MQTSRFSSVLSSVPGLCLAALVLAAAAPQARAEAQPPRADLKALCPGVEAQLSRTLGDRWLRSQEPAKIPVQLRIVGNEVTAVHVGGALGPGEAAMVRQALRRLQCDAGREAWQIDALLDVRDSDRVDGGMMAQAR